MLKSLSSTMKVIGRSLALPSLSASTNQPESSAPSPRKHQTWGHSNSIALGAMATALGGDAKGGDKEGMPRAMCGAAIVVIDATVCVFHSCLIPMATPTAIARLPPTIALV